MQSILVVEDEPALRAGLVEYLTLKGLAVEGTGTAAGLLARLAADSPPALIILDLGLPDGDGFALARKIRRDHDCGLIMLTSPSEVEDRVRGYQTGADIYLVKHTFLLEIEAAVQSLLRRVSNDPRMAREPASIGWVLNKRTWTLIEPNHRQSALTATEMALFDHAVVEGGASLFARGPDGRSGTAAGCAR